MHQQEVPSRHRRCRKVEVPVHKGSGRGDEIRQVSERTGKISRRFLIRENERLLQENTQMLSTQEHLNKKNCKLKEKITEIFSINEELSNENTIIKEQFDKLLHQYNDCYSELQKPKVCQNCVELGDFLDKSQRDYTTLRKTNREILEDCEMLKNVVYRLNVQLERYQQKLQSQNIPLKDKSPKKFDRKDENVVIVSADNIGLGETHYGHVHSPVGWGKVNTHTLGPLLNAYQETMNEKDEIIESYEAELGSFTLKMKDVVKENESLHSKLNDDLECSKMLGVQLENVKLELKASKDQNDLLIKKCALKQDKIEEILKCYEQKVEQLKRDYSVLHDQYSKSKTDICSLKERNKSLTDVHDDFKNERHQYIPVSVHTSSVNECKRWYEELKKQYENEKVKLLDTIEQLKQQISDLTNKIALLNSEKLEMENKLKSSDKHVKKMEAKYLEMEHNFHEVQLSRSACRKQLHKAMTFAKDLVAEQESLLKALNQRQQENKVVKRIGTDIASRMDLLRSELKVVQKEAWNELSTVEERIQEQDVVISEMKKKHLEEIDNLLTVIKEKDKTLLKQSTSNQQF